MRIVATIINIVLGIITLVLGLRFLFRLFGLNSNILFVNWIYSWSEPFLRPFQGILPDIALGSISVLELSTLVALIIFGVLASLVRGLFD